MILSNHHIIISAYYHIIILSNYRILISSNYHFIMLSYYIIIVWSNYHTILRSDYRVIILSYYHIIISRTIVLSYYQISILSQYHIIISSCHHTLNYRIIIFLIACRRNQLSVNGFVSLSIIGTLEHLANTRIAHQRASQGRTRRRGQHFVRFSAFVWAEPCIDSNGWAGAPVQFRTTIQR